MISGRNRVSLKVSVQRRTIEVEETIPLPEVRDANSTAMQKEALKKVGKAFVCMFEVLQLGRHY